MRQRLKRIRRAAAITAKLPRVQQLREQAKALRKVAPDDVGITRLCDAVETIADAGGFVRRGPRETKQRPLLPEWGGKEPPENL
jgi:hypothetical protein